MPDFNLITSAVNSRSTVANGGTLKNLFAEINDDQSLTLYGTEGKTLLVTAGATANRGMIKFGSNLLVVSGYDVYRIDSNYSATLIGSLLTNSGYVGLASNGLDIILVDGSRGYIIDSAVTTLTQIAATDFPNSVTWAVCIDGYYLVGGDGTQNFYGSGQFDGSSWDALSYAVADHKPDLLVKGVINESMLLNFGTESLEFWSNTGNADFPFERSGNAFLDIGCLAVNSVSVLESNVFWLGQSAKGKGVVYKLSGYSPTRISTHAIEHTIQQWATPENAYAFAYSFEGHSFYVLSCTDSNESLVYDLTTSMWHTRTWFNDGHHYADRANSHVFFNGVHIVGDRENGNIYQLDMDVYTDNAGPIVREFTSQHFVTGKRTFYSKIEIRMETGIGLTIGQGSNPQMMLSTSKDNGKTWISERNANIGALGSYSSRVIFNRLGSGFSKTFRFRIADPIKVAITGARLEFT